jgi:DNA-binding transcriptional ArsR family regulator
MTGMAGWSRKPYIAKLAKHLAVLEGSGLVRSLKVGRVRTCRIEPEALSLAEQWINPRRAEWEQHFNRLGEYLSTLKEGVGTHAKDK